MRSPRHLIRAHVFVLLVAVAAWPGCGSSVATGESDGTAVGEDAIGAPDGSVGRGEDTGGPASDADPTQPDVEADGQGELDSNGGPGGADDDVAGPDDTSDADDPPPGGQLGAPCEGPEDCFSGFCVDSHDGKVCSKTCTSDCPPGWACTQWSGGGDLSFICVPLFTTLCRPCMAHSDCIEGTLTSGSRCVSSGLEGAFCGGACDGVGCPEGFSCEQAPDVAGEVTAQCVPDEGICPCFPPAIALQSVTSCGVANQHGTCEGTRLCAEEGLTACEAATPEAESCDGEDDDCDDAIDEGFGLGQACDGDDEDHCLNGVLACGDDGGVVCEESGEAVELCDGFDNDCDQQIDEGFPGLGSPCDGDDDDLCVNGVVTCDDDGGTTCVESKVEVEVCNALDDDCDGEVDEGLGLGEACDSDDGDLCANGVLTCGADDDVVCAETLEAGETCNGEDDDCDGEIDETFPTLGQACDGDDADLCPTGLFECSSDGSGVVCGPEIVSDLTEVCDGEDDDCDDLIDEGFDVGGTCDGDDDDLCANGLIVCNDAGAGVCEEAVSVVESCNGADDDCDGETDEGFDVGAACDGPDADLCASGEIICTAGGDATCEELTTIVEVCDGEDDDCDGEIDEGFDVGAACDGDDADLCANGAIVCDGFGLTECEETEAAVEICNAIDDDCDGETDEGFGVGETCDGTDDDLCANGVVVCDGDGGSSCQETASLVETCNGVDDDCDDAIDEGFGLGAACDSNDADLCANGTVACDELGGTTCVGDVDVQEVCNGADDDCDDAIDEGFAVGTACDTDDDDLCANGTVACNDVGGSFCTGDVAVVEVCNGLDDDCDGDVDETFPTLGDPCDGDDADLCSNGTITCDDAGGTTCSGDVDVPEICNGADDDCDDAIDETFPQLGDACDGADDDLCANGTIACNETGGAACVGDIGLTEICNGEDDDCDDEVDETFPQLGDPCDSDDADFCANGVIACTGDLTTGCEETTTFTESCGDDVDNDCDGDTDEGCVVTTIVIPEEGSVGPPVADPATTGGCSHFGAVSSTLDPHNAANIDAYMDALATGATVAAADVAASTINYSVFPATGCTSPGDFPGAESVGVNAGGTLTMRIRGMLNIQQYTVWTLLVIGNDAIRVRIAGQEVALLSWSGLGWKYSVDVSFESGGLYPIEVEWTSNQSCSIDPLEIAYAEGQIPGYNGVMHCGPSTGSCGSVATPDFQLLGGDVFIPSTDGDAVTCARCASDDDCPGTCNPVGLCE